MSGPSDPLIRAWLWLGALSLASATAAEFGGAAPHGVVGVVVLVFATFKARLIPFNRELMLGTKRMKRTSRTRRNIRSRIKRLVSGRLP